MTPLPVCDHDGSITAEIDRVAGLVCWHALAVEGALDDRHLAARDRDVRITHHVDELVLLAVELLGHATPQPQDADEL